eukprot:sb/3469304/
MNVYWIVTITIGAVGILSNVYSLCYNFRRKGFPRQLYIVLNFLDLSVSVIGISITVSLMSKGLIDFYNSKHWATFFIWVLANQTSGLWTCIVGGARLLSMSLPFYQINKKVFWSISIMLLAVGVIPQGILIYKFDEHAEITIIKGLLLANFVCATVLTLVNLVLTVWTGILLIRKSDVAAEIDPKRRNAAVTVVLLCVVFLLTNICGAVAWCGVGFLKTTLDIMIHLSNFETC